MWILECDGDALHNKKIWLRPNKTYLFGRTKPEKGKYAGFQISHKSVSRKHLTLHVGAVTPEDAGRVNKRSTITLEDEGTKIGTQINGVKVATSAKTVLDRENHSFRLGSYPHTFTIHWHPILLTLTLPSSAYKNNTDPLLPTASRIVDIDLKCSALFSTQTTHVISAKRNTPKSLSALICSRHIVTAAYIDALIAAATPTNLDEPESMCPLEEDFERNWPDEREYLPPPGREPGPREGSWYVPDATGERREIFKGFEFVFFDSRQFETLMGPITDGAGKALLYEVEVDGTSVGDVLGWARKTLGDVATADLGDEEEPGAGGSVGTDPGVDVGVVERDEGGKRMGPGLVFVKFQGGAEWEAWAANLQRDLALACNMRLIEQNEFLDVILRRDPGLLRRRLPVEYVQDSMVARTQVEFDRLPLTQSQKSRSQPSQAYGPASTYIKQSQPSPPSAASALQTRRRGKIVSMFKGFDDDDFDPTDIRGESMEQPSIEQPSTTPSGMSYPPPSQKQYGMISDSDAEDHLVERSQVLPSRKRSAPPPEFVDDSEADETMFPAAAAMKRRRLEEDPRTKDSEGANGQVAGASTQGAQRNKANGVKHEPASTAKVKGKGKVKKEVDIQTVVRERREAAERAAADERDDQGAGVDDMTVSQMKALAVIEEMEMRRRTPPTERAKKGGAANGHHDAGGGGGGGGGGERWDPAWNGRKNFKKFRRRGGEEDAVAGAERRRGQQGVMVPLEEVRRHAEGGLYGDAYWATVTATAGASGSQGGGMGGRRSQREAQEERASFRRREREEWRNKGPEREEALLEGDGDGATPGFVTPDSHAEEQGRDQDPDGESGRDEDAVVSTSSRRRNGPEAIDVDAPAATRAPPSSGKGRQSQAAAISTSIVGLTRPSAAHKRHNSGSTGVGDPKRQKRLDEDVREQRGGGNGGRGGSGSEDEMKFKFRRRR